MIEICEKSKIHVLQAFEPYLELFEQFVVAWTSRQCPACQNTRLDAQIQWSTKDMESFALAALTESELKMVQEHSVEILRQFSWRQRGEFVVRAASTIALGGVGTRYFSLDQISYANKGFQSVDKDILTALHSLLRSPGSTFSLHVLPTPETVANGLLASELRLARETRVLMEAAAENAAAALIAEKEERSRIQKEEEEQKQREIEAHNEAIARDLQKLRTSPIIPPRVISATELPLSRPTPTDCIMEMTTKNISRASISQFSHHEQAMFDAYFVRGYRQGPI